MSITDQVSKVVKGLANMEELLRSMGFATCGDRLNQDARLLAALAAEVEAWRIAKPLSAVSLIDTPIRKARQATDALLVELGKEKTNGQV